jgi:thiamine kinase-like enzyme
MPGKSNLEALRVDLLQHPAVRAWGELGLLRLEPERVGRLYNEKKTQVYKLHGVGPDGSNVIAKRSRRRNALLEQKVYEKILPQLPLLGLHYYGCVEEPEGTYCWLFLEEARGLQYSPQLKEHREWAAQWIAAMHASAAGISGVAALPDRSARYYLQPLREAHAEMQQALGNPVLTANRGHVALVETMMSQLEELERKWDEVAAYCERIPSTLVHGDLNASNVRVRRTEHKYRMVVIDWEKAGWGVPAIDLSQLGGQLSISPDLSVYQSLIQASGSPLGIENIGRLAHVGAIFRLISGIRWATRCLLTRWVEEGIWDLEYYEPRVARWMERTGW